MHVSPFNECICFAISNFEISLLRTSIKSSFVIIHGLNGSLINSTYLGIPNLISIIRQKICFKISGNQNSVLAAEDSNAM